MAVLTPAALMAGPADEPTPAPDPVARRVVHARPDRAAGRRRPSDRADRGPLLPDDAAAADAFPRAPSTASRACCPDGGGPRDGGGVERLRYPTTTLSTVLLNLRPTHPELRDVRVRKALLGAIDRDALRRRGARRATASRRTPLVPPASWAYDAAGHASPVRPEAAAKDLTGRRLDEEERRLDGAKGARPRTSSSCSRCRPTANPRLAAVARRTSPRLDRLRDRGRRRGVAGRRPRDPAARRRLHGGGARHRDGPRARPLPAARVDPGAGRRDQPLAATRTRRWTRLLEAARTARRGRRAHGRLEGAARRSGGPDAAPAARLAQRERGRPRGRRDPRRGSSPTPGDRFWDVLAWRLAADR